MKQIDVKEIRQQLDLTQAELAAELGVNQATVAKWERGDPMSRGMRKALERFWREAA